MELVEEVKGFMRIVEKLKNVWIQKLIYLVVEVM